MNKKVNAKGIAQTKVPDFGEFMQCLIDNPQKAEKAGEIAKGILSSAIDLAIKHC